MKDCVSCVHEYLSPMSDTCHECGIAMLNYEEAKPKPITNYDRIRAKSVEEMAEFLAKVENASEEHYIRKCGWLDWLKREAEE